MRSLAALLFAFALSLSHVAQAGDSVWSALVLATNEKPPAAVPTRLENFAPTIAKVFGYNSVYLLGHKRQDIDDGTESWLVPSREFFFQVQCLRRGETFYEVRLNLFQEKTKLFTTEARLARNAPLYIRGPQWGDGQLILLLEIR